MVGLLILNNFYWLEHNQIVLPANTSYSFSPGYVGEYKCTVVGLCLLVCLQVFPRLCRLLQVYCSRSMFTSLSTVSSQAMFASKSVL